MAKITQAMLCGVDVSLQSLDIAQSDGEVLHISNTIEPIDGWLSSLPEGSLIALEATSTYHEAVLERAMECGHQVYVVNGKQLHHYREAVNQRAKTDSSDAALLLRYLTNERSHLEPVTALNAQQKRLWRLLKRRAALVRFRAQAHLSLGSLEETRSMEKQFVSAINAMIKELEKSLRVMARELGWERQLQQCQSIPGIGWLNALGLVACFHRGQFGVADKFVAFLGLDVRVRDSGTCVGRRKLTKRGDSEMRRLLYNAAMSFARDPRYKPLYERLLERGRSSTAAYVILARKLVRIAFCLLQRGEFFDGEKFIGACATT